MEIERRFLLKRPVAVLMDHLPLSPPLFIMQSYLPGTGDWAIRYRREASYEHVHHTQTLKRGTSDMSRDELEHEISKAVYDEAVALCGPAVRKDRCQLAQGDLTWEIDSFLNPLLLGIEIAEIELPSEDHPFDLPDWIGREITGLKGTSNHAFARALEKGEFDRSILA